MIDFIQMIGLRSLAQTLQRIGEHGIVLRQLLQLALLLPGDAAIYPFTE